MLLALLVANVLLFLFIYSVNLPFTQSTDVFPHPQVYTSRDKLRAIGIAFAVCVAVDAGLMLGIYVRSSQ